MCELDFELDKQTKRFLKKNVNKLSNVAPERIKMEILKIVNSKWNSFDLGNIFRTSIIEKLE